MNENALGCNAECDQCIYVLTAGKIRHACFIYSESKTKEKYIEFTAKAIEPQQVNVRVREEGSVVITH